MQDFYRAGVRAIAAPRAALRIDPVGMLLERYLKLAGFAFDGGEVRGQKDIDVFMKQTPAKTILRTGVPVHQRKHFTHSATVGGKLIIELT
jgi:hypothetical protein